MPYKHIIENLENKKSKQIIPQKQTIVIQLADLLTFNPYRTYISYRTDPHSPIE